MVLKPTKRRSDRTRPRPTKALCIPGKPECQHRLSRKLKYDTDVPGDRGDCEQKSLSQGSE